MRKAQSEREANTRTVKDPQAKIHKHTVEDGHTNTQEGASNPVILTKTLIQARGPLHWVALRERFARALRERGNAYTSI